MRLHELDITQDFYWNYRRSHERRFHRLAQRGRANLNVRGG